MKTCGVCSLSLSGIETTTQSRRYMNQVGELIPQQTTLEKSRTDPKLVKMSIEKFLLDSQSKTSFSVIPIASWPCPQSQIWYPMLCWPQSRVRVIVAWRREPFLSVLYPSNPRGTWLQYFGEVFISYPLSKGSLTRGYERWLLGNSWAEDRTRNSWIENCCKTMMNSGISIVGQGVLFLGNFFHGTYSRTFERTTDSKIDKFMAAIGNADRKEWKKRPPSRAGTTEASEIGGIIYP